MNQSAKLGRAVLATAITTATFLLVGAAGAWAGPAPLEPERGPADSAPSGSTSSADSSAWEFVTVGVVSAALAILLTLIVMYAATHRHGGRAVHA